MSSFRAWLRRVFSWTTVHQRPLRLRRGCRGGLWLSRSRGPKRLRLSDLYRASASSPFERLEPLVLMATDTWTGTGNWTDGTHWSTGSAPGYGDNVVISSGTVTSSGNEAISTLTVDSGATLIINSSGINGFAVSGSGSLTDDGTIQIGDSSASGELELSGQTLSISGSGAIVFGNSGGSLFGGSFDPITLDSGVTISGGGGTIDGDGTFVNDGTIDANVSGGAITVDPPTFTNNGTVEANGGTLTVNPSTFTNFSSGTLSGGTWQATGGGTLDLDGDAVTTNAATILLDGSTSAITDDSSGDGALAGLTANSGSFTIQDDANFTFGSTGTFTNSGTFSVGANSTFIAPPGYTYLQTSGETQLNGGTIDFSGSGSPPPPPPPPTPTGVVIEGGTLAGTGTIADNLTIDGGVFSPSSPVAITGQFTEVVTNTADSGAGSLREAITEVDNEQDSQAATIAFAIPGSGVQTISPLSPLPAITSPVVINGTTQPGYAGKPLIQLAGGSAGGGDGLDIYGGDSTVEGLDITGFAGDGILLASTGNTIESNYIGIDPTGTTAVPNGGDGVDMQTASVNSVLDNTISGNTQDGINISGNGALPGTISWWQADNNANDAVGGNNGTLKGNATYATGPGGRAFSLDGVNSYVDVPSSASLTPLTGVSVDAWINPVSLPSASSPTGGWDVVNELYDSGGSNGAGAYALRLLDNGAVEFIIGTSNTSSGLYWTVTSGPGLVQPGVFSNVAGTYDSATGELSVYVNGQAASVTAAGTLNQDEHDLKIGADLYNFTYFHGLIAEVAVYNRALAPAEIQNIVALGGAAQGGATIQGNMIGTNAAGTAALANAGNGIELDGSSGNTIGGANTNPDGALAGAGNLISGNTGDGVYIDAASGNNTVEGNFIGTDVTGTTQLGNGGTPGGAQVAGVYVLGNDNTIGGTTPADRNVISGNTGAGVYLASPATGNAIEGNYIGTNSAGTVAVPNATDGIDVEASGNTIGAAGAGNVISGNAHDGLVFTAGGSTAIGNYIGTNAAGNAALANAGNGVYVAASNNIIGGAGAADGNLISGNGIQGNGARGVLVATGADGNTIEGNFVGTNAAGNTPVPNVWDGVGTYGNDTSIVGNLISGNGQSGVALLSGSSGDSVTGNLIGTDVAGTLALPNAHGDGIWLDGTNDTIGGTSAADRNVISASGADGVELPDANDTGNVVEGNYIGTNAAGTGALANGGNGVEIDGGSNNTIGGANTNPGGALAGAGNLISGNTYNGVVISGASAVGNAVEGNYIGSDVAGTAPLANGSAGIDVFSSHNTIGAPGAGNVISGNLAAGITVSGTAATGNIVQANYIGTNAAGTGALANGGDGIDVVNGAPGTLIGTNGDGVNDAAEGNVVSGNNGQGVYVAPTPVYNLSIVNQLVTGALPSVTATGTVAQADFSDQTSPANGDWSYNNPVPGGGGQYYALIGTGTIDVATAGAFTFDSGSDDGSQLLIDGNAVVTDNETNAFTEHFGTVTLTAGTHSFEWIGFQDGGSAGFEVSVKDGANQTGPITTANGWHVLGDPNPDPAVALEGTIAVTVYYSSATGQATIAGNYIGTNASGTAAVGNGGAGIYLDSNTRANRIGTSGAEVDNLGERNVISGNGWVGVYVAPGASGNLVAGDYIGTNAAGNAAIGNASDGLYITGPNNTIGGITTTPGTGLGNLISSNAGRGVEINGGNAASNRVQGNLIGTDGSGAIALGNAGDGVSLINAGAGNTIGGAVAGAGNVDSANGRVGIWVDNSSQELIAGNLVGTNAAGNVALGDGLTTGLQGIQLTSGSNNDTIGGTTPAARNVIAASGGDGVLVYSSSNDTIEGNYIGTNAAGTAALANAANGVEIDGGSDNIVGGLAATPGAAPGNVISGNAADGVLLDGGASGNTLEANDIGTSASGTAPLANGANGVEIASSSDNTIGGASSGARNLISGNATNGVLVDLSAIGNTVEGNYIGTNVTGGTALANGLDGVSLSDAAQTNVAGNLISGNAQDGLQISNTVSAGPVDWWHADGNANDSVGTNNGTLVGGVSFAPGVSGQPGDQAFSFSGSGQYVALPNNFFPYPTSGSSMAPFTFETWFETPSVSQGGGGVIFGQQVVAPFSGPSGWVPGIWVGSDGLLRAEMFWFGGVSPITSSVRVDDGRFHEVAVVFNGSTETLYLDGAAIGSENVAQYAFSSNYYYQFGTGYTNGWPGGNGGWDSFKGLIDEPQVYSRALSASDVQTLYQAQGATAGGDVVLSNVGNTVSGNDIGTTADGTAALPNAIGIVVSSADNIIGGTTAAARNVISGNAGDGMLITGGSATGNTVEGNYIGTNAAGTVALANLGNAGVELEASGNTIGGVTAMPGTAAGNVISGNRQRGVTIWAGSENEIEGNILGLNAAGSAPLANGVDGVELGADGNTVAGNVISGNGGFGGMLIDSDDDTVAGNLIGTDITGTVALGNTGNDGIYMVGASDDTIGGSSGADRNVISGNSGDGIYLAAADNFYGYTAPAAGDTIEGNNIIGNTGNGINILQGDQTTITGNRIGASGQTNGGEGVASAGTNTLFSGANVVQSLAATAGSVELSGSVTSTGDQNYGVPVTLLGNSSLTSTGGAIAFGSTIDGGYGLTTQAAGSTTFGGAIGGTTALASLSVTTAGPFTLPEPLTTTGNDSIDLTGPAGTSVSLSGSISAPAVAIDGGAGLGSSFTGSFAGGFTTALTLTDFEQAAFSLTGDLSGQLSDVESGPNTGVLDSVTIDGDITATGEVSAGAIAAITVTGTMAGAVHASGQGTISNGSFGTVSGTISAPEDNSSSSGQINSTTINSVAPSGSISTGAYNSLTVTGTMAGTMSAAGQGTINNSSFGTVSGTIGAPEDSSSSSGQINSTTINSVAPSGSISTGAYNSLTVTGTMAGTMSAAGQGTINNSSFGTVSGTIGAPEDSSSSSGQINSTTINSVAPSGSISTGAYNSLTVTGTMAGTMSAAGQGTINNSSFGTVSGTIGAPEDSSSSSGQINSTTINSVAPSGSISTGAYNSLTVTGTMAGTMSAAGQGTINNSSFGTVSGTIGAPEDSSSSSGQINSTTINSVAPSGSISTGAYNSLTVTGTMAGTMSAAGQGTINNSSFGTVSGTIGAPEDSSSSSGQINSTTINSVAPSGSISTGAYNSLTVTGTMAGTMSAAGQGTINNSSFGTVSGTIGAPEDSSSSSGQINSTTINSVSSTGSISTGAYNSLTVTGTMAGTMSAAGQGTINNSSFGTVSGTIGAPEDSSSSSGQINSTTISSVSSTGSISTGAYNSLTVTGTMAGTMSAAGQGTINNSSFGTVSGTIGAPEDSSSSSGQINSTTINSVSSTGSISTGAYNSLTVTGTMAGTMSAAGQGTINNSSFGTVSGTIGAPEDSRSSSGQINSTTINSVSSTGSISTGSYNSLTVSGTMAGTMSAAGQGTINNSSFGTVSGTIGAPEDSSSSSGQINSTTINSVSSTGSISTGAYNSLTVTGTMAGTMSAAGQGTINNSSFGTVSGTIGAPEDSSSSSGQINSTTISSVSSTGSISTGAYNSLTVTGTMAGTMSAAGQGTINNSSFGTVSGTIGAPEDSSSSSGQINSTTISSVSSTGSISTGAYNSLTVSGTMAGTMSAAGQGTINNSSFGTVSGTIGAPEDSSSSSGQINSTTINSVSSTGSISTGAYNSLTVTGTMAGTMSAAGQGTINNSSFGTVSGTIGAPEDSSSSSGQINSTTISSVAPGGSISTGSYNSLTVSGTMAGTMSAAGQGTINNSSFGTVSGTIGAPEDSSSSSGQINSTTISSVAPGGSISTGSYNSLTVTGTMAGTMSAAGQGTINNSSFGTVSGTIGAPEDSSSSSGQINSTTINSVSSTGSISTGAYNSLTVTGTMAGTMSAAGQGTINGGFFNTISGLISVPADTTGGSGVISNFNAKVISGLVTTGVLAQGTVGNLTTSGRIVTNQSTTLSIASDAGSVSAITLSQASIGTLTGTISSQSVGTISLGTVGSGGSVTSQSVSSLSVGTVASGGTVTAQTVSSLSVGTLSGSASLGTLGQGTIGTVTSGGSLSGSSAGSLSIGNNQGSVSLPVPTNTSVKATVFGQAATFTATVTANVPQTASGSVDFFDVTTNEDLGSVAFTGGSATLSNVYLPVGSQTIDVTYSGGTTGATKFAGSATSTSVNTISSLYVLNPTASGALTASGNASINLPGVIAVDSTSKTALAASGNAKVAAAGGIDVVGGASASGNATFAPKPQTGGTAYTFTPPPAPAAGATQTAVNLSGNSSLTIYPGDFEQIAVSGNANLTMKPGVYIITGGGFSVSGNASVTGSGVVIYNAGSSFPSAGGSYGYVNLSGNGTIGLSAATTGPYAGILIDQPSANTQALSLSGNSMGGCSGAIFAPGASATVSGNGTLDLPLVVSTLTLSGNSVFNDLAAQPAAGSTVYTPAQIRTAYGLDQVADDGTGQTIAIVDAYDDPDINDAVDTFDSQFGLTTSGPTLYDQYGPAASFLTVVNQAGQAAPLPATDPAGPGTDNWELEETLDVEWAHAIAPGARIVLVEANSQSLGDLMAAVQTAAGLPGVSVVSMSWGFVEGQDVLAADEQLYDSYLTTPPGHQGVTFVASTGDYGAYLPEYPAFSPNVVAVGGTSLYLNGDNSYLSESGWGGESGSSGLFVGGGGGVSLYESEPAYQLSVQSTGYRTTPDVSFVADPNTGAWIADTYNLPGSNPWEIVGGTSLSAPSFAGLFALVNQGRVAAGETTLNTDSPTEAQQALYSLPPTDYHDLTSGSNGYSAGAGYDLVTGLGTPVANLLVPDLVAYSGAGNNPAWQVTVTTANAVLTAANGTASANALNGQMNALPVFDAVLVGGSTAETTSGGFQDLSSDGLGADAASMSPPANPGNSAANVGAAPLFVPSLPGTPNQNETSPSESNDIAPGSDAVFSAIAFDGSLLEGAIEGGSSPFVFLTGGLPGQQVPGADELLNRGNGDDLPIGGDGQGPLMGGIAHDRVFDDQGTARSAPAWFDDVAKAVAAAITKGLRRSP